MRMIFQLITILLNKSDILNIHKYLMNNNNKMMLSLIKEAFIVLSFSSSLAPDQTKCLFLNGEPCMVRPNLIDLNPAELKYYPFMISLDKEKYVFQKKQKT